MKSRFASSLAVGLALFSHAAGAQADTFEAGSLIIPMDTDYQDEGMFLAFGLVYQLLLNNVEVNWIVDEDKAQFGADFTASAVDVDNGSTITDHAYRGGPWIISADSAAAALPVVESWLTTHPEVVVHQATAQFDADVARTLVVAPTIAMFADGNQKIARKYVQAAQIPDSVGSFAWADASPDMLTPDEVAGATTTSHSDGALFDSDGDPVYCQLMSMHWGVNDARSVQKKGPEVVAEVRQFLTHPVHFFAECQAVNAFENDLVSGLFLTTQGFEIGDRPDAVDYYNAHSPFAQLDGTFGTTGGSESAYSLPVGQSYKASDIVMLTEQGTPVGVNDVWMTGFLDGACSGSEDAECGRVGKVSYLGGHEYTTAVPLTTNPGSWGTKLFLNSLFEAPCATSSGQPQLSFQKSGPAQTSTNEITYFLSVENAGPTVALAVELVDVLPAGATFVSASNGGVFSAGAVTWDLQNLGVEEQRTRSVTVTLSSLGSYANTARLDYRVGSNDQTLDSNEVVTVYDADTDGDGVVDALDTCPSNPNAGQDFATDVDSCGTCGNVCTSANGTPVCSAGTCSVTCSGGFMDCNDDPADGCEVSTQAFLDDEANCGGCGLACDPANGTGTCASAECAVTDCDSGFADCNAEVADGCEYSTTGFATDPLNCGACGNACAVGETCTSGACVPTDCAAGTADCDPLVAGCEVDTATDEANCGGCGLACDAANGTGECVSGACTVASCDAGFEDCDGLVGNGCEYDAADFASDPLNCSACGALCDPPNASATCTAGECVITSCAAGTSDLDGDSATGCESVDPGAGGAGSGGAGSAGGSNGSDGGRGPTSGMGGASNGGEAASGSDANSDAGTDVPGTGLGGGSNGQGDDDGSNADDDGSNADDDGSGADDDSSGADDANGTPDDDAANDDDGTADDDSPNGPNAGRGDDDKAMDDDGAAGASSLEGTDAGLPLDQLGGAVGADGCGCRTVKSTSSTAWVWVLSALALAASRRRGRESSRLPRS